jgi:hypothetical protein
MNAGLLYEDFGSILIYEIWDSHLGDLGSDVMYPSLSQHGVTTQSITMDSILVYYDCIYLVQASCRMGI